MLTFIPGRGPVLEFLLQTFALAANRSPTRLDERRVVQVDDSTPHLIAVGAAGNGKLDRMANRIRGHHIRADVDLAAAGESDDILVLKRHWPGNVRLIVPPKRMVALCRVAGLQLRAGQIEILPVKGEPRLATERVPVVNPGRRVALANPPFAEDAKRALFPVHRGSELALVESIESRAREGRLVTGVRQRRQIGVLGFADACRFVPIRIDISRRPQGFEMPRTLLLHVQDHLGFDQVGVEVAPTTQQLPVQLLGVLATPLIDVVVEIP